MKNLYFAFALLVMTGCAEDIPKDKLINTVSGKSFHADDFKNHEIISAGTITRSLDNDRHVTSEGNVFSVSDYMPELGEPVNIHYERRQTKSINTNKCNPFFGGQHTDEMQVLEKHQVCGASGKWCSTMSEEKVVANFIVAVCA